MTKWERNGRHKTDEVTENEKKKKQKRVESVREKKKK